MRNVGLIEIDSPDDLPDELRSKYEDGYMIRFRAL